MADTLVDTSIIGDLDWRLGLWGPYWSDESVGVIVFINNTSDLVFARTDDKGATWATTTIHSANIPHIACWYDKETPGNSGTLVHIAWLDSTSDDCFYRTLDVSDGSLGTQRTVDATITTVGSPSSVRVAVTQTVSGNILVAFSTQTEIGCYKSSDNFATAGTAIADVYETTTQEDWVLLFPAATADDDDACALFWDRSANEISLKVYDDSGDAWTEKSISGSMVDSLFHINMDASVRHSDSKILGAAHSDEDSAGDDLITFELTVDDPDAANCTVTAKTNVFTNQDESAQVAVWINQQTDEVRIAYLKGGTWEATVDVVYHISPDGMGMWDAELAYSQGGPDDFRLVHAGRTVGAAGGRYQPSFYDDDEVDIYVNEVNDTEILAGASISVIHAFPHGGEKEVYGSGLTGPDPTSGSYWVTQVRVTAAPILHPPTGLDVSVPTARSWWIWEHAVSTPAEAADQDEDFFIFGHAAWWISGHFEDANPPTYYTIRLNNVTDGLVGEGTTQFALGGPLDGTTFWRQCRLTWLSGQIALEVDGTYEVNASTPQSIPLYSNFDFGGDVGGVSFTNIFLRKVVIVRGDSSSDRPDETTQAFAAVEPGGNGGYTGWTGVYTDYDDWNSGGANDGDTTVITPPGTSTVKETASLSAQPTITASYEHALWNHHHCRITGSPAGAKSLGSSLIYDGTNEVAGSLGASDTTSYLTRSVMYKMAPDGAVWDADAAANLEIGAQGEGTAVPTGLYHTAIWGEWCKYALDAGDPPGIPVSVRRHVSVTHG